MHLDHPYTGTGYGSQCVRLHGAGVRILAGTTDTAEWFAHPLPTP
jgi:hypothetical protein